MRVSNQTNSGTVTFWHKGPNSNSYLQVDSSSVDNNGIANVTYIVGGGTSSGQHDFKANSSYESASLTGVKIDKSDPSFGSDQEYVRDGGSFSFTVSDAYTDVTELTVQDQESSQDLVDESRSGNVCGSGDTCDISVNIDTGSISDGNTLDLEAQANDSVGNTGTREFDLTVDNSYDGDDSPGFSVEGADDSRDVVMESSDEELDLTVDLGSASEDAPIGVKCYVGGNQVNSGNVDYQNVGSDGQEYTCTIDGGEYSGSSKEVYVEACDEAGNCIESEKESYSFDASKPFISSFETVEEYNVFNDNFKVTFQASDDASGVAEVEYFFDQSTLYGQGNTVQAGSGENFTVDTSSLSSGAHKVYLRVKDNAGRWSSSSSLSFEYYPNSRPKLGIEDPGNVTVTAGKSKTVDVTVRNPGKLYVESAKFTVSGGDFLQFEKKLSGLGSGDSAVIPVEIGTNASDVGKYTLTLQTSQPRDTVSTTLLVEANKNQEQRVESKVSNYTKKLEQLNQNISDLRSGGLTEELNETLTSNVSEFVSSVRKAEKFANQGDYYRALSALEGIDKKYEQASKTYSKVERKDSINERNRILKMLGGLVLLLAIGGGAYVVRSGDYDFDLSEYRVPEMGGVTGAIEERFESLKEALENEEEEAQQKFQGFS